jgi:nucleoside-diphosphate-sugar epimerase
MNDAVSTNEIAGSAHRVLLAGATGVLGRALVPRLLGAGHQVTGITRTARGAEWLRGQGATAVVADVLDRDALAAAVAGSEPTVVMHQLTDLSAGDLAANAALRERGTRTLVEVARGLGVRRVIAQSICWAYRPGERPAVEDEGLDLDAAEPRRTSVVGVAALEAAVREVPEHVVLRYGLFYGPGTWYAPDGAQADAARAGALRASPDVASFVHVDDAAAAAVAALDWPTGAVNVCDDEPAPGTEWVPAFCRAVGASSTAGPPPGADRPRAGSARGADNRHAREDLGWKPRWSSWRAGFAALERVR